MSVDELPVSANSATLTTGAALSSVKLSVAVAMLPSLAVWLALSVCAPSAKPGGMKLQAPVPSVSAMPSVAPPSLMMTRVLG